jgi:hypothetical protein
MFKFGHDYKLMLHLSHTQMVKIPVLHLGKYSNNSCMGKKNPTVNYSILCATDIKGTLQ